MRYRYNYLIYRHQKEVYNFAQKRRNVSPDEDEETGLIMLSLYPDIPEDAQLIRELEQFDDLIIGLSPEYTAQEMEAAPWFNIWPVWCKYYPQPDDDFGYQRTTYTKLTDCKTCSANLEQVDDFYILPSPKRMKHPFQQMNWVHDELFISGQVKQLLMDSGLSGFTFRNVRNFRTKQPLPDMYQLVIECVTPPACHLDKMDIKEELPCPECGIARYNLRYLCGPMVLDLEIMSNLDVDICKSGEYFGFGGIWTHKIFISHDFYMFLKKNHFEKQFNYLIPILE